MADVRMLKKQLQEEIANNSVSVSELFEADKIAGISEAWRVVMRDDGVDVAAGHWGWPVWDNSPTGQDGTTNLQWITRWMSGHPDSASGFPPSSPSNGIAEVQIKKDGRWYNAKDFLRMENPQPVVEHGDSN